MTPRRKIKSPGLRTYTQEWRAAHAAKLLAACFPEDRFEAVSSPLQAYAFCWLIKCTKADGRVAYAGKGPLHSRLNIEGDNDDAAV